MKNVFLVSCLLAEAITSAAQERVIPELSGPYLDQKPLGMTLLKFAPGFMSTDLHEFGCSFTPDGKHLFFASGERRQGDIWWISAKVIEELRPREMESK